MTTTPNVHYQGGLWPLRPSIKNYSWGSKSMLSQLTGRGASNVPEAEMWFGTHPSGPSLLKDGSNLRDRVQLPFLVKLLAAQHPLSIQAHPNLNQARIGFARENAARISLDHPKRNYRDANHKPELLVALTQFKAMVGFRRPHESAQTFALLAQLGLNAELTTALKRITEWLSEGQLELVFDQLADPEGRFGKASDWTREIFEALSLCNIPNRYIDNALTAASIHTNDAGALLTLLMNHITLSPGEALFVPSSTIHAYFSGLGLEVMAMSDNVIRGGLTVKHVDVAELRRILSYEASPVHDVATTTRSIGSVKVTEFLVPVREFILARYDLPPDAEYDAISSTPQILICTTGAGDLSSDGHTVKVAPGSGIFVEGGTKDTRLSSGRQDLTVFAIASR